MELYREEIDREREYFAAKYPINEDQATELVFEAAYRLPIKDFIVYSLLDHCYEIQEVVEYLKPKEKVPPTIAAVTKRKKRAIQIIHRVVNAKLKNKYGSKEKSA